MTINAVYVLTKAGVIYISPNGISFYMILISSNNEWEVWHKNGGKQVMDDCNENTRCDRPFMKRFMIWFQIRVHRGLSCLLDLLLFPLRRFFSNEFQKTVLSLQICQKTQINSCMRAFHPITFLFLRILS